MTTDKTRPLSYGYDTLELMSRPVLPAQPGFEHIQAWPDEGDELFFVSEPIIGWRLLPSWPEPITIGDGDSEGAFDVAIKCPDGRVVQPTERSWENEAEWREYVQQARKKLTLVAKGD